MSHYDILGVPRTATHAQIKAAYRAKSKDHHPDRDGGSTEAMQAVNKAYEVLGDVERRKAYDETGSDGAGFSVDAEARSMLMRLFTDALDLPLPVLDFVHSALDSLEKETRTAKSQAESRRARLVRRRPTVAAKTGDNLFHDLVDSQLAQIDTRMNSCETLFSVVAAARRLLNGYEAIPEAPIFSQP